MTPPNQSRLRWNGELTLGAVVQAGVVIITAASFVIASSGRTEQTQRDLVQLRTDLTSQIVDMRQTLQAAVTEMRADVRTVPVRLDAVDRWIQAHETRSNTSENRLSTIERSMAALQAEMDLLNNVANGPLGPRGRTR